MWQYHEKIWENVEKIRGLTNEFGGYLNLSLRADPLYCVLFMQIVLPKMEDHLRTLLTGTFLVCHNCTKNAAPLGDAATRWCCPSCNAENATLNFVWCSGKNASCLHCWCFSGLQWFAAKFTKVRVSFLSVEVRSGRWEEKRCKYWRSQSRTAHKRTRQTTSQATP